MDGVQQGNCIIYHCNTFWWQVKLKLKRKFVHHFGLYTYPFLLFFPSKGTCNIPWWNVCTEVIQFERIQPNCGTTKRGPHRKFANGYIIEEYNIKLVACRLRLVNAVKEMKSDRIPPEFMEMFLKYTEDPYTCFKKQFEPREPLAIITHGDYLRNNIAFKFDVRPMILGKSKMRIIHIIYL